MFAQLTRFVYNFLQKKPKIKVFLVYQNKDILNRKCLEREEIAIKATETARRLEECSS